MMKLGAVPYLNALPLIRYLPEQPLLAPPAALDRLLRLGEIDLATAPISTLFENPNYRMVPGLCIATRREVKSVCLFFKKPGLTLQDVGSIYLDLESKVSALLLKVILHFKYKRDLKAIRFFHPLPSPEADAHLLIGNKAMSAEVKDDPSMDLGLEWTSWTGLPFVFAGWIGRVPELPAPLLSSLKNSVRETFLHLETILGEPLPVKRDVARSYLKENVCYELGEKEIEGMRRFHAYGKELGFFQHDFRLNFYPQR